MAKAKLSDRLKNAHGNEYFEDAPDDIDDEYLPEEEKVESDIYRKWEKATDYLNARNYFKFIRMCEDYYENRQRKYMPPSLPNIVFNVVAMIENQKQSTICESPTMFECFSNRSLDHSYQMTRFLNSEAKRMGFEKKKRSAVKGSLIRANAFIHLFWCEDMIGQDSIAKGGVKIEEIHPFNIRYSNPTIKDIQDQEYIIIASRENVKRVRTMCDSKESQKFVVPDDNEINVTEIEQNENELCTVYTMYFRINNEVYFQKATRNVTLCEPKPLNPNILYKAIKASDRDKQISKTPDEKLDKPTSFEEEKNKFYLYPVAPLTLKESTDSYIGISDVEDMIPGQNAINVTEALAISNGIDMQVKYIVKPDALRGQVITNEIGQRLTDYSKGAGDGIKILAGAAQMNQPMLNLPLTLMETLKKVKSTADVTMGDVSKEYSATAISLLQTAAEKPTEEMTKQTELFVEEVGKILILFAKFYYTFGARYSYQITEQEKQKRIKGMAKELNEPVENIDPESVSTRVEDKFFGQNHINDLYDIEINAGAGGKLSQATQFQWLIQYFQLQGNLTPDQKRTFIKATPTYIFADKAEMLALVDAEESGIIAELKGQVTKLEQAIQTYQMGSKEMATIIDTLQRYIKEYEKQVGSQLSVKDATIKDLMAAKTPAPTVPQLENKGAGVPTQK